MMKRKGSTKTNPDTTREDVHVRRNAIETALLDIKHYVQNNGRVVLRAGLILVLLVITGAVFYGVLGSAKKSSYEELYKARKILTEAKEQLDMADLLGGVSDKPKEGSSFQEKSRKEAIGKVDQSIQALRNIEGSLLYSFSGAKALASYYIAMAHLYKVDYTQAADQFARFADKNPDYFLAISAKKKQGYSLEMLKKYKEAFAAYSELYKKNGDSYMAAQALFDMGRMAEKQQQLDIARKHYTDLIQKFQNKSFYFVRMAQKRLYLIGKS